eukprot:2241008-Rhodomonas_salina.3
MLPSSFCPHPPPPPPPPRVLTYALCVQDRSVPAVDNRTRVDEDGWRHEPIEEEHEQEQEEQQWKPTVLSDGYTVSMMLPRATLEG